MTTPSKRVLAARQDPKNTLQPTSTSSRARQSVPTRSLSIMCLIMSDSCMQTAIVVSAECLYRQRQLSDRLSSHVVSAVLLQERGPAVMDVTSPSKYQYTRNSCSNDCGLLTISLFVGYFHLLRLAVKFEAIWKTGKADVPINQCDSCPLSCVLACTCYIVPPDLFASVCAGGRHDRARHSAWYCATAQGLTLL